MTKFLQRFRIWNEWRKSNCNHPLHKLLVLLGLRHSPTFNLFFYIKKYKMDNLGHLVFLDRRNEE